MIINQTGGGTTPTGITQITSNGTHNVAGYEFADVNVPTTAPALYREFEIDANGVLQSNTATTYVIDLTGVHKIQLYSLYQLYYNNNNILSLPNFSDITTIGEYGMYQAFAGCGNAIGNADFSNLKSIAKYGLGQAFSKVGSNYPQVTTCHIGLKSIPSGSNNTSYFSEMFSGNEALKDLYIDIVAINSASSIFNYVCKNCTNLENVYTGTMNIIRGQNTFQGAFSGCVNLKNNPFDKVRVLGGSGFCTSFAFQDCISIVDASFYKLEIINNNSNNFSDTFGKSTNLTQPFALSKLDFPALVKITGGSSSYPQISKFFSSGYTLNDKIPNLNHINFPMLTVVSTNVFNADSFKTGTGMSLTLHFRIDAQTDISTINGYSTNFGATAIVFDLVGTITVNNVDYIRQGSLNESGYIVWQKKASTITEGGVIYNYNQNSISDFTGALIDENTLPMRYGWVNGSTTIYTDTLNPQIGDGIYTSNSSAISATRLITAVDTSFLYTSDSVEPAVNDTVYSDASLSTVAGTITAIA